MPNLIYSTVSDQRNMQRTKAVKQAGRNVIPVSCVWRPDNEDMTNSGCHREMLQAVSLHDSLAPAVISHIDYMDGGGLINNGTLRGTGNGNSQIRNGYAIARPCNNVGSSRSYAVRPIWTDSCSSVQQFHNGVPVVRHYAGVSLAGSELRHRAGIIPCGNVDGVIPQARAPPPLLPYMMSPLALHSPLSLSLIIPPPVRTVMSPAAAPLRRLSINIPCSPPPENGMLRGQQPLGDGLLTTRPSLMLMAAQPLVNCYMPLLTPVLGPTAALQWTCASVANFG